MTPDEPPDKARGKENGASRSNCQNGGNDTSRCNGNAATNGNGASNMANGHAAANGHSRANGLAWTNGHAASNGEVMVNGFFPANGLARTNGSTAMNGAKVNGCVGTNGMARANGNGANGSSESNGTQGGIGTLDMFILDEATPFIPAIAPEMDFERKRASDRSLPLKERLEAYEVIIDSEVGDTSMTRARNIEREIGLRQVYLKFEGGNPTGTQKDRIAFAQCRDALRRGYDEITVASCGNYGSALALAAALAGLRCIVFIPKSYHTKRDVEMNATGAEIRFTPGTYEDAVVESSLEADKNNYYDANPGGINTQLQLSAYGSIAYEIYDDLRDAPAAVAVPVSNGTTLAGIHRGFLSLFRRGKTSRIPTIIAGSSYRKNPIVQAYISNSLTCEDLNKETIKETAVNEPLISWHSIDGDLALMAIRESRGWAGYASDKKLMSYSRLIREREGLNVLPASTAGLIALVDKHNKEPFPGDRYVVIMTGRKV
ncbi:MAG: pyridoxal-phosphate dependent enzyme [Thermoplasmata archaeon]|nr:pyridoxal-phosphate dependent enzyme [Thermoplasmata archaeon]